MKTANGVAARVKLLDDKWKILYKRSWENHGGKETRREEGRFNAKSSSDGGGGARELKLTLPFESSFRGSNKGERGEFSPVHNGKQGKASVLRLTAGCGAS